MKNNAQNELLSLLENSVQIKNGQALVSNEQKLRANIHRLAEVSALGSEPGQANARYLTRLIGLALKTYPASIHELYIARGRGDIPPRLRFPRSTCTPCPSILQKPSSGQQKNLRPARSCLKSPNMKWATKLC